MLGTGDNESIRSTEGSDGQHVVLVNGQWQARYRLTVQQQWLYSPWQENFVHYEYRCAVPRTHFLGRDSHETWPRPQGCLKGQFWALG